MFAWLRKKPAPKAGFDIYVRITPKGNLCPALIPKGVVREGGPGEHIGWGLRRPKILMGFPNVRGRKLPVIWWQVRERLRELGIDPHGAKWFFENKDGIVCCDGVIGSSG